MDREHSFIDPDSLAAVAGRCLFYPVAGSDCSELLVCFGNHVSEFHFCDINYCDLNNLKSPFAESLSYRRVATELSGEAQAHLESPTVNRKFRYLEAGTLKETYQRVDSASCLTVIRRRGFGQYALAEFKDRSIGIFVHRGDSRGEGGSNVFFLANKKRDHEPLSNLFSKLAEKLADRALIVSDGSNVRTKHLRRFLNHEISSAEAFDRSQNCRFAFGGFDWTCVGYIGRRNGPTLVWQVKRTQS